MTSALAERLPCRIERRTNIAAVPFDDLLAAFFTGLDDEKRKATPPLSAPYDKDVLTAHLKSLYTTRWRRRQPEPGTNIVDCATVLGRLTLVMFRSELLWEPNDDPIDDVTPPPNVVGPQHIDRAREMYGFYTNHVAEPKLHNVVHGPLDKVVREIDQPCPLCP